MYDLDILGDFAEDFMLVCRTVDDSIKEFTGMQIAKVELAEDETGTVNYDQDQFISVLKNVHTVRTRSETLKALFYDGFKLMAEEASNDEQHESTDTEGE